MRKVDAYDCILTKLDVREFSSKPVPHPVKLKILDAARVTGSGMNVQHWRFILVQNPIRIHKLAEESTTGSWVNGANFAVIVLTSLKYGFRLLDAGRALQDMQLAAWNLGVASGIYTGVKEEDMRKDFGIPPDLEVSAVIGFGYPTRKLHGKKNRRPLHEIAYLDKYGNPLGARRL